MILLVFEDSLVSTSSFLEIQYNNKTDSYCFIQVTVISRADVVVSHSTFVWFISLITLQESQKFLQSERVSSSSMFKCCRSLSVQLNVSFSKFELNRFVKNLGPFLLYMTVEMRNTVSSLCRYFSTTSRNKLLYRCMLSTRSQPSFALGCSSIRTMYESTSYNLGRPLHK